MGNVSCCGKMRCLFWQFYLYLETTDSHLWAKLCIPLVACFHFWSPPSQDCLFVSLACSRVLSSKMHHCSKNVSLFVSLQAPSWYRFPAGVTALSLSLSLSERGLQINKHIMCVLCVMASGVQACPFQHCGFRRFHVILNGCWIDALRLCLNESFIVAALIIYRMLL